MEILQQEPVGSFLVRESTSKPGCYALSVRVPKECQKPSIAHYLITQTNRGFKIKVRTEFWLPILHQSKLFLSFKYLISIFLLISKGIHQRISEPHLFDRSPLGDARALALPTLAAPPIVRALGRLPGTRQQLCRHRLECLTRTDP